ncbi:hypothetical protein LTR08_009058 [Meristemomyces frigidus]|nr:hypothetical protein LTR08_009058 [Meristemomyces frigidus]
MPVRSSGCYLSEQSGGIEFRDQTSITVRRAKGHPKAKDGVDDVPCTSPPTKDLSLSLTLIKPAHTSIPWIGEELLQQMPMPMPVLPANMLSPAAFRSQLYSEFIDIYIPKTDRLDHFSSFFERIAAIPTEQPALLESLDALSLATLGSLSKDKTLLNLSVRTYGRALKSLGMAISRAAGDENVVNSDDLLATASVLSTCALYDEIGQHADGWGKHVKGCQQLITARSPESIKSELSLLLFHNTRHGALICALIERKAPLMARPDWRSVALRSPIQDTSALFYDIAIQIPGMLERYDSLIGDPLLASLDSDTTLSRVDGILVECQRLESDLHSWLTNWQFRTLFGQACTAHENGILYRETSIDEFPTFTSLCADRTFETAFMFPSFAVAYWLCTHWLCLHFLRTTIQSLHNLRQVIDETWYPEPGDLVAEDELLMLTFNICKCIPYFCEPVSCSTGQCGSFLPIRTAAIYFTLHGHWKHAKWVGAIRNSIFVKGMSPPNVREPPSMLSNLKKPLYTRSVLSV